jgi:hypothetical protein
MMGLTRTQLKSKLEKNMHSRSQAYLSLSLSLSLSPKSEIRMDLPATAERAVQNGLFDRSMFPRLIKTCAAKPPGKGDVTVRQLSQDLDMMALVNSADDSLLFRQAIDIMSFPSQSDNLVLAAGTGSGKTITSFGIIARHLLTLTGNYNDLIIYVTPVDAPHITSRKLVGPNSARIQGAVRLLRKIASRAMDDGANGDYVKSLRQFSKNVLSLRTLGKKVDDYKLSASAIRAELKSDKLKILVVGAEQLKIGSEGVAKVLNVIAQQAQETKLRTVFVMDEYQTFSSPHSIVSRQLANLFAAFSERTTVWSSATGFYNLKTMVNFLKMTGILDGTSTDPMSLVKTVTNKNIIMEMLVHALAPQTSEIPMPERMEMKVIDFSSLTGQAAAFVDAVVSLGPDLLNDRVLVSMEECLASRTIAQDIMTALADGYFCLVNLETHNRSSKTPSASDIGAALLVKAKANSKRSRNPILMTTSKPRINKLLSDFSLSGSALTQFEQSFPTLGLFSSTNKRAGPDGKIKSYTPGTWSEWTPSTCERAWDMDRIRAAAANTKQAEIFADNFPLVAAEFDTFDLTDGSIDSEEILTLPYRYWHKDSYIKLANSGFLRVMVLTAAGSKEIGVSLAGLKSMTPGGSDADAQRKKHFIMSFQDIVDVLQAMGRAHRADGTPPDLMLYSSGNPLVTSKHAEKMAVRLRTLSLQSANRVFHQRYGDEAVHNINTYGVKAVRVMTLAARFHLAWEVIRTGLVAETKVFTETFKRKNNFDFRYRIDNGGTTVTTVISQDGVDVIVDRKTNVTMHDSDRNREPGAADVMDADLEFDDISSILQTNLDDTEQAFISIPTIPFWLQEENTADDKNFFGSMAFSVLEHIEKFLVLWDARSNQPLESLSHFMVFITLISTANHGIFATKLLDPDGHIGRFAKDIARVGSLVKFNESKQDHHLDQTKIPKNFLSNLLLTMEAKTDGKMARRIDSTWEAFRSTIKIVSRLSKNSVVAQTIQSHRWTTSEKTFIGKDQDILVSRLERLNEIPTFAELEAEKTTDIMVKQVYSRKRMGEDPVGWLPVAVRRDLGESKIEVYLQPNGHTLSSLSGFTPVDLTDTSMRVLLAKAWKSKRKAALAAQPHKREIVTVSIVKDGQKYIRVIDELCSHFKPVQNTTESWVLDTNLNEKNHGLKCLLFSPSSQPGSLFTKIVSTLKTSAEKKRKIYHGPRTTFKEFITDMSDMMDMDVSGDDDDDDDDDWNEGGGFLAIPPSARRRSSRPRAEVSYVPPAEEDFEKEEEEDFYPVPKTKKRKKLSTPEHSSKKKKKKKKKK